MSTTFSGCSALEIEPREIATGIESPFFEKLPGSCPPATFINRNDKSRVKQIALGPMQDATAPSV
jgi:hypothetical protein